MSPAPRSWNRTSRRLTFWLGILVLLFLGWAWWLSHQRQAALDLATPHGIVNAERRNGATWLSLSPGVSPWSFSFYHRAIIPDVDWDEQIAGSRGLRIRFIPVPDSLVFFSFVGMWGGWLVWRARVERKRACISSVSG